MLPRNVVMATIAGLAVATATLGAQENTVVLSVHGGAQSPRTDLTDGGSARLESGFNIGGGVSLALHPNVALKGEVTWARSDAHGPVIDATTFNRLFYGGDVQVQYPFDNGLKPYVFAGLGGVRIVEDGADADAVYSPAARLGGGLEFSVPGMPIGIFGQAAAWNYKFYGWPGLDENQWDAAYSAGISYRLDLS